MVSKSIWLFKRLFCSYEQGEYKKADKYYLLFYRFQIVRVYYSLFTKSSVIREKFMDA